MKDLHCHLPFGISDGPPEMSESLEMLRIAAEHGVTYINAVTHYSPGRRESLEHTVDSLRDAAARHNIELHAGFEYTFVDLLEFKESFLSTGKKNNTILVDMNSNMIPAFALMRFYEIMSEGNRIILVHPEILFAPHALPLLAKFADMKILFMLNAASFLPEASSHIRKMAYQLLHSGMAHMIASDAHSSTGPRRCVLREAREILTARYGEENARLLFEVNPTMVLENRHPYELHLPEQSFWKRWFSF